MVRIVLVLTGFMLAHLCNADIDLLHSCRHEWLTDRICHKLGPLLIVLALMGRYVLGRSNADLP